VKLDQAFGGPKSLQSQSLDLNHFPISADFHKFRRGCTGFSSWSVNCEVSIAPKYRLGSTKYICFRGHIYETYLSILGRTKVCPSAPGRKWTRVGTSKILRYAREIP